MKILKEKINKLLNDDSNNNQIIKEIATAQSLDPFSTEARQLSFLLSTGKITYEEYNEMGKDFCERNRQQNKYIELFDMSPRTFGQTWGEQHIRKLFPDLQKATKESLADTYPDFDGEFDLWTDGIRVEVKACRANSTNTKGSLSSRAYTHEEAKASNFKYHYQQLKPSCCDIFIWIGVCKDELIYWVLTSEELQKSGKLGSQHRNENTGKKDAEVFEGQVFMTEEELTPFLVSEKDLLSKIIEKATKGKV